MFSLNSFTQVETKEYFTQVETKEYKVITIDSTENNYIIFLSTNLLGNIINTPFLSNNDDCYTIYEYDKNNTCCLFSPKINGLNRNVYVNKIYKLTLNCITNITMTEACEHIGYGDYILQYPNDKLYKTKEIAGLLYTQNSDTLNYFSNLLYQNELFDGNMLKIWMSLDKSKFSYSKWLKKQINNAKSIYFNDCNMSIVLCQDENCKNPYTKITSKDYCENNILEVKILYKYKRKCFIKIGGNLYHVFGWTATNTIETKQ